MTQSDWYANNLDTTWRQIVATDIFKIACQVVLEEASSVRTPPQSSEVNALQNQFREGMFSAIRSLRALAVPKPGPKEPLSKPWERKMEVEAELPAGPIPPDKK